MRGSTASPAASQARASSMAFFGGQRPGMVEIEIGNLPRQSVGIGQPGAGIGGGVTADGAGALHGGADRLRPPVGGAGRACHFGLYRPSPQDPADGGVPAFPLRPGGRCRQGATETDVRLGGGGALGAALGQNIGDQGFQLFPRRQRRNGMSDGFGHGSSFRGQGSGVRGQAISFGTFIE